jgi:hypothetical protein
MKSYPSIPRRVQEFTAEVFDKLDGSNMRSEWAKKGWFKHGRRNGLLDESNEHLVVVEDMFMARLAEPLERIAVDNKWQHLVVFYEFWGNKSLAGQHEKGDPKFLTVFDAAPNKKGLLGPEEFRRIFEDKVPTARYLGRFDWTDGFVERVRKGEVEGVTFEGVVGKAGTRHDIVRAKAKTQQWLDAVRARYGEKAKYIIES